MREVLPVGSRIRNPQLHEATLQSSSVELLMFPLLVVTFKILTKPVESSVSYQEESVPASHLFLLFNFIQVERIEIPSLILSEC